MAFKFNLQSLLKHRKRLESEAQKNFYEAQSKANAVLNEIEAMYNKIDNLRIDIQELVKKPEDTKHRICQINEFIELQKIKIENKKCVARELLSIADEKKELLLEASREYKVICKLKEKRKSEYLSKKNKKEQKKIDEISIIKFNHRSL